MKEMSDPKMNHLAQAHYHDAIYNGYEGINEEANKENREWITNESESKQTKQQAKVLNELDAVEKAEIVKNRSGWAEEFLKNVGYAPQSYCKQDSSTCPEGFRSSCYVTVKGCTPKWVVKGDEKCSDLLKPDHNEWLTSFSTSASAGEIRKADETYCNEYKCTKNIANSEVSFCRDVNEADRNAKKAAGNMAGGYSKASLKKLINSGTAQGLFDEKQEAEANEAKLLKDVKMGAGLQGRLAELEKKVNGGDGNAKKTEVVVPGENILSARAALAQKGIE